MNKFTIKDIENLSGIKAHTWRIWEQRHGLALPHRKDSNHRFYDNENLKMILRISYLYHKGIKISKIAALGPDEIREKSASMLTDEIKSEYFVSELIECAIDLDEEKFEQILNESIKKLGLEQTITSVIFSFQEKIGALWLTDHLIPAQEHFTSNLVRQKLAVAINDLPYVKETSETQFLLFTPENEYHEIPLQFIHYLLKKAGKRIIYFGRGTSLSTINSYVENRPVTHILFYLVTNLSNKNATDYLQEVCELFKEKTIMMAGAEVRKLTMIPENVTIIKSWNDVLEFGT